MLKISRWAPKKPGCALSLRAVLWLNNLNASQEIASTSKERWYRNDNPLWRESFSAGVLLEMTAIAGRISLEQSFLPKGEILAIVQV